MNRKQRGKLGEDMAVGMLSEQGYRIIERNWWCRHGEVDVVTVDPEGILVFVEVRTRASRSCGTPAESVTREKLTRMRRVAGEWLREHRSSVFERIRLDLIAISMVPGESVSYQHYRGVS